MSIDYAGDVKERIEEIQKLLEEATDIYNALPGAVKDMLCLWHNEHGTLPHCLRWGNNAVYDVLDGFSEFVADCKDRAGGEDA
jgi:hypothetical protein